MIDASYRLRVLHVVTDSFSAYEFVLPFALFAQHHNVVSTIACSSREYADAHSFLAKISEEGIEVHDITLVRSMASVKDDVIALVKLVRLARQRRFDLIHTRLAKAGVLGRVAAALARIPCVHTVDDFAFVDSTGVRRFFTLTLERMAARFAHRLLFVSENERQIALESRIGYPGQLQLIGNGIRLDLFDPKAIVTGELQRVRANYGAPPPGVPIVGGVGRLVSRKGWDVLMQAAHLVLERHPNARFLVVGGGREEEELRAQATSLGITGAVTFTGFIDTPADMPYLYALMDIFCLPSRREGFGMVFAEAGAMQVPVIANDIPPINEVVLHEETGLLAPLNDHVAFAAAICRLLESDSLRVTMGERARERVRRSYDIKKQHLAVLDVYEDVVASSRGSTT